MSKNRNQQQQQQRPPVQQTATQQPEQQQEQQQQNQEDQVNQQASQDTGAGEQQSNDQAAVIQTQQNDAPAQPPVNEKPVINIADAAPQVRAKQEGFVPVLKVQLDLVNYNEAMDRTKSIVPQEGGRWQYSLFNTLKAVLNAKDQEQFNKEWNTALMFFHQNKDGIFNENFLFRFPAEWPGSANEYTLCRRMLYIMIQTANAKTRKAALKEINLELAVEGMDQAQRTKFLNFYEA